MVGGGGVRRRSGRFFNQMSPQAGTGVAGVRLQRVC